MSKTYSAGIVTAYGAAKRAGYQGTYEDFCRQQAEYAENAQAVEQAKQTAVSASQSANQAKQDAQTASTTAQQSAQSAQGSSQSAGQSAQDAQTAESNAQTYAQSASQSAGSAQQSAQTAQAVFESIPDDYSDLSEDVDKLKADLGELLNDEVRTVLSATWVQNRVQMPNNVLTETTSTQFAHSNFIPIDSDITIEVASGYKIFAWTCAYDEFGHGGLSVTSVWSTGKIDYTYQSQFPYLIICCMKDNSGVITAEEATNAVTIYNKSNTIFALKTSVNDLQGNVDDLKNGVEVSTESLPLTFQSGRVTLANNTVTVATNSSYAYMKYAPLRYGVEYNLNIPVGLDAFGYIVNLNNGTYTKLESFAAAWTSGVNTVKHTISTEMQYYYLILSVKKTAGGSITTEEASAITVTYVDAEDLDYIKNLKLNINKSAFAPVPTGGQILYNADTSASADYIVNALSYNDGIIIACRSNGKVVKIGYDGVETELLSLSGSGFDWRLCWMDSNKNVYVSPHASWGSMTMTDRGLYKLAVGESSFTKVIALYDPNSSIPTEKESNNDTIWTMCEDADGNLYAGVYAHTTHANPAIYKSTDGGDTWAYLINFNSSRYTTGGRHIHTIVYDKWKKALYCIVGEINTIFKSVNGGTSWINLEIALRTKGSALLPTRNGLLIGSDGAYNCEIDLLYNDDTTHETVFSGWANTVFGIKQSDLTGFIYAFTKIDSSVSSDQYMPSYGVLHGTKTLEAWKAGDYTGGSVPSHLSEWEKYNASVADKYPNDAIRPQHFSILVSRNGGFDWEILKAIPCDSRAAYGIWTIGQFHNGECLCGIYTGNYIDGQFVTGVTNPVVISEGKHKYVNGGCDLDGEIFIRTNTNSIVSIL